MRGAGKLQRTPYVSLGLVEPAHIAIHHAEIAHGSREFGRLRTEGFLIHRDGAHEQRLGLGQAMQLGVHRSEIARRARLELADVLPSRSVHQTHRILDQRRGLVVALAIGEKGCRIVDDHGLIHRAVALGNGVGAMTRFGEILLGLGIASEIGAYLCGAAVGEEDEDGIVRRTGAIDRVQHFGQQPVRIVVARQKHVEGCEFLQRGQCLLGLRSAGAAQQGYPTLVLLFGLVEAVLTVQRIAQPRQRLRRANAVARAQLPRRGCSEGAFRIGVAQ